MVSVLGVDAQGEARTRTHRALVHLAAPGWQVLTTHSDGGYRVMSGSSVAAPHASAALALLSTLHPNASAAVLRALLLRTARPLPTLAESSSTGGLLDVGAAVRALP